MSVKVITEKTKYLQVIWLYVLKTQVGYLKNYYNNKKIQ